MSPPGPRPRGYSRLQIWLHWLVAALVLLQLVVNAEIRVAFSAALKNVRIDLSLGAASHLAVGLAILLVVMLRLTLKMLRAAPLPPDRAPPLLRFVGTWTHRALYALLLLMTVSGTLAWFGRSELAATFHEFGRVALVTLIVAHALGAIVEHFILGTRVFARMNPLTVRNAAPPPDPLIGSDDPRHL